MFFWEGAVGNLLSLSTKECLLKLMGLLAWKEKFGEMYVSPVGINESSSYLFLTHTNAEAAKRD